MRNYWLSSTIFLLILASFEFGCSSFDEKEEAAVYRSYIDQYYVRQSFSEYKFRNKPFSLIVISDKTSGFVIPFSYQEDIVKLSPQPDRETVKDFLTRNDGYFPESKLTEETLGKVGRYPLNRFIKFNLPHALISDSELRIVTAGQWKEFYRRYPNSKGLVALSRVGFNKNRTQALLYFTQQYDPEGGEGYLVLFSKINNEWQQIARETVWIS